MLRAQRISFPLVILSCIVLSSLSLQALAQCSGAFIHYYDGPNCQGEPMSNTEIWKAGQCFSGLCYKRSDHWSQQAECTPGQLLKIYEYDDTNCGHAGWTNEYMEGQCFALNNGRRSALISCSGDQLPSKFVVHPITSPIAGDGAASFIPVTCNISSCSPSVPVWAYFKSWNCDPLFLIEFSQIGSENIRLTNCYYDIEEGINVRWTYDETNEYLVEEKFSSGCSSTPHFARKFPTMQCQLIDGDKSRMLIPPNIHLDSLGFHKFDQIKIQEAIREAVDKFLQELP